MQSVGILLCNPLGYYYLCHQFGLYDHHYVVDINWANLDIIVHIWLIIVDFYYGVFVMHVMCSQLGNCDPTLFL